MSKFTPASLPDLTGFIAIVTGGHSGLGLATTTQLARHGARVYIASRTRSKVEEAMKAIVEKQPDADLRFLEIDLGDLRSVKKGAEEFLKKETQLHILINNAGVMCTPFSLTPQNIESQFQTNYLSHFNLTALLLPLLRSTALLHPPGTVRIVNVSSDGHSKLAPKEGIPFADMAMESKSTWSRYGMSKLAQVLHAKELAARYGSSSQQEPGGKGIVAVSLHPGTVKTGLSAGPRGSTPLYRLIQPLVELGAPGPERGCWNTLWCAASRDLKAEENGGYFEPVGKKARASVHGDDAFMAKRLWEWSESVLREKGLVENDV